MYIFFGDHWQITSKGKGIVVIVFRPLGCNVGCCPVQQPGTGEKEQF